MKRILAILTAALIALSVLFVLPFGATADISSALLHTEGNQLIDGNGHAVRLIGLNVPYMGWDVNSESKVMSAVNISNDEWQGNAIRLAVKPELWFGADKEKYRALADKVIETVSAAGKYVILDNHSFYLPDDDDVAFWKDAALRYANHPNVIFELFNEPAACTWQQYYEGGTLTYKGQNDWGQEEDITINSCGMPKLFETVRSTGAKNICILPGINWSFDLSYCTEKNFRKYAESIAQTNNAADKDAFINEYTEKYFIKETDGNGIMYSTHPYPTKPSDWDMYLKDTALEYPVLVGECGPTEKADGFVRVLTDNDKSYLDNLADYVDKYELNITPWAWGAWPYLNQEPSDKLSAYGAFMKKYFEQSNETKAITLYSGIDYTEKSLTLEAGSYTASQIKDNFDLGSLKSVSSKKDAYQYTITLYEKENYSGKAFTFVPNAANVGKDICGFTPKAIKIERSVPQNILPGHATVIAPGCVENQPPENIIDGKNGSFWKNVDKNPNELVICLDKLYALNGITIAHAAEASMMSVFNASDYTVSVSTDGKTFTRIIDVTDNSLGLCEYNFEQVLACYIKIKITKGSIVDNTSYYLAEVMAYGTPYTGSTEGMSISVNSYNIADDNDNNSNTVTALQWTLICVFGAIAVASIVFIIIFAIKRKKNK